MKLFSIVFISLLYYSCRDNTNSKPTSENNRIINYYPDGKVQEIKYFKDSMLNGECFWFYPNGKLEQKVSYVNSEVNGHVDFYFESGAAKEHKFYIKGKPFGYATTYYNDTISIIKEILLFDGEGKLRYKKEFDSSGKVVKVEGEKY
jgi:antitoxin component YwqK of YwqJK toxin-antitoxin module